MAMIKKVTTSNQLEIFNNSMHFPTTLNFLRSTNGLRPGSLHGLIGTMGSGKTNLMQKIIAETAETKRVGIWLSEETADEYSRGILRYSNSKQTLDNIRIFEEQSMPDELFRNHDKFLQFFQQTYVDSDCDIMFVDNATTSQLYSEEAGFINQSKSARFVVKMCKGPLKATMFYLAHTNKKIKDNSPFLMVPEDIRGNAQLPIRTEYFYCMQKFTSDSEQNNIIITSKHRHHSNLKNKFHLLEHNDGKYIKDDPIPFQILNDIFKGRDQLGKKDS